MAKLDARKEKRERNEAVHEKYKKSKTGRQPSRYQNWCRIAGHAPSCRCLYPTREELIALHKGKK